MRCSGVLDCLLSRRMPGFPDGEAHRVRRRCLIQNAVAAARAPTMRTEALLELCWGSTGALLELCWSSAALCMKSEWPVHVHRPWSPRRPHCATYSFLNWSLCASSSSVANSTTPSLSALRAQWPNQRKDPGWGDSMTVRPGMLVCFGPHTFT